ncbi:hypothetical protein D9M71_365750 [compost metagenome]
MLAHDPVAAFQALVEHRQQARGLLHVAVAGALILVILAGEFVEEAELAEHRADAAHLEHQPLDAFVAAGGVLRDQLAGLLRQVDEDGAGLEQRQRAAVRPLGVDDRGNLVVRVEGEEFRRHLVVALEAHQVRLVGQAGLFQHDRDLDAVGRRQGIELQAVRLGRGPFAGNGESRQIIHGDILFRSRSGWATLPASGHLAKGSDGGTVLPTDAAIHRGSLLGEFDSRYSI